jgi:23S rRNA (guanosine2251-2'-O)-methyltransferase
VLEALKAGHVPERILVARGLAPSSVIGEIRRRAEGSSIPVDVVPRDQIDRLEPELNHQGVVALAPHYRYTALERILGAPGTAVLFCDGIMDPHNLGSLLRSADGAGAGGVVIPARRAVAVTPAVRRVSAGAAETMPVARVPNIATALERARSKNLWVAGLDQDADDDLWTSSLLDPPAAIVVGAEDRGLSTPVRDRCDGFVSIPSAGRLSSLNVAAAGAVALFEVARRARALAHD